MHIITTVILLYFYFTFILIETTLPASASNLRKPRISISLQTHSYSNLLLQLVAGQATPGFSGDGGPATSASLRSYMPWVDSAGNIYVTTDNSSPKIRKVSTSGTISAFGGNGLCHSGQGGPILSTCFNSPISIVGDTSNNYLIFSDQWFVWQYYFSSNIVSVIAGTASPGFSGDNTAASGAQLNSPTFIWLTTGGVVYIADSCNHRIRKISTNIITTVAGSGSVGCGNGGYSGDGNLATSATLSYPTSAYVDTYGKIFIADYTNIRVRLVHTNGIITTYAGNGVLGSLDNVQATLSTISCVHDVKGDTLGNIFLAEPGNRRIRIVEPSGIINTIIGTGNAGFALGILPAISADNNGYLGIWIDSQSNLYVCDQNSIHRTVVPSPTSQPSNRPTAQPTRQPSSRPSSQPSRQPTASPTSQPSRQPSCQPTALPSRQPSSRPTTQPTGPPVAAPSSQPSRRPSSQPTSKPSRLPTISPSVQPTSRPSNQPFSAPSGQPSSQPTAKPSNQPSGRPSRQPTRRPTTQPSRYPSVQPTSRPSGQPLPSPTAQPTVQPSTQPSNQPSSRPSRFPTIQPTTRPSRQPSVQPTSQPSLQPSCQPTRQPLGKPTSQPSFQPTCQPTSFISGTFTHRLVAYYPFDGNARDQSGNGNNGEVHNATLTSDRFGNLNSAYRFDGSSSYIKVANGLPFDFSNDFSVAFWMKQTVIPNHYAAIISKSWRANGGSAWFIEQNENSFNFIVLYYMRAVSNTAAGNNGITLVANEWNHCSITKENSKLSNYVNGRLVSTVGDLSYNDNSEIKTNGNLPLFIGVHDITDGRYFKGLLDDVFIFNRTLTADEVMNLYQFGAPTSQPSTGPTSSPTSQPSNRPTLHPSNRPCSRPSLQPMGKPTSHPSNQPISHPTVDPSTQPTEKPSFQPTTEPTFRPSSQPSDYPTRQPSVQPSSRPSDQPTVQPTDHPSAQPSSLPTSQPTEQPFTWPTGQPSSSPSVSPSVLPTIIPTRQPVSVPSAKPTSQPIIQPSGVPTIPPSSQPSSNPAALPTLQPSSQPTSFPLGRPSQQPNSLPTSIPSVFPNGVPAIPPTQQPSSSPSGQPSNRPSTFPSGIPSRKPFGKPNSTPSELPARTPSRSPTSLLTLRPTNTSFLPSVGPSSQPPSQPTSAPSKQPSNHPSLPPTSLPSIFPTDHSTSQPSALPTTLPSRSLFLRPSPFPAVQPSSSPNSQPTDYPTLKPTTGPSKSTRSDNSSLRPSFPPTFFPSIKPSLPTSSRPSSKPTVSPFSVPTRQPSSQPSCHPLNFPTGRPSRQPASCPTSQPSNRPTAIPSSLRNNPLQPHSSPPTLSVLPFNKRSFFKQTLFYFGSYLPAVETIPNIDLSGTFVGSSYVIFGFNGSESEKMKEINIGSHSSLGFYAPLVDNGLIQDPEMSRSSLPIGDFNGDSSEDLLVCDPVNSNCNVYSEKDDFKFERYLMIRNEDNELFGWSTAKLNDVNQDGCDDIAITSLSSNIVYVIFGVKKANSLKQEFVIKNKHALPSSIGIKIIGSENDQNTGLALSSARDFDNDGYSDLLFSAIQTSPYQNVIYVLFLRPEVVRQDIIIGNLIPKKDYFKIIAPLFSFAGFSVSNLGDINQDGFDDIIIGSLPYSGRYLTQKSYVIYGRNFSSMLFLSEMSEEDGFIITGGGFMVGGPGDVNGDGIPDIMIGSYQQWQGKGNSYIMVYPRNITSPPTFLPSSQPSSVPSHFPTSLPSFKINDPTSTPITVKEATDLPASGRSTFPPFLPTSQRPSVAPKTSKPFRIPSLKPSTRLPTTKTNNPSFSPSRKPTVNPTKRPPTRIPSRTATTGSFPSTFPTSVPSMTPSVSLSTPFQETTIDSSGAYTVPNGNVKYTISGEGSIEITSNDNSNDGGRKIYTILPSKNIITIANFHKKYDQISLIHFPYLHSVNDLVYRTNPLQIFLSNEQKLILVSIDETELTEDNYIFQKAADNNQEYQFELDFASMISLGLLFGCIGLCGFLIKVNEEKDEEKIREIVEVEEVEQEATMKDFHEKKLSSDFSSSLDLSSSESEITEAKDKLGTDNSSNKNEKSPSMKTFKDEDDDFQFLRQLMEGNSDVVLGSVHRQISTNLSHGVEEDEESFVFTESDNDDKLELTDAVPVIEGNYTENEMIV
jgi:hypothetical protein